MDYFVSTVTLRTAWILLKLYKYVLHINILDESKIDLSGLQTRSVPTYRVNAITVRNTCILFNLYRDVLHINISDLFDVDLSVSFYLLS